MPTLSDPTTWRQTPQSYTGYLWIDKPAAIYSARVNQSSFTYPIAQITYDTGSGTLADVKRGMLVFIGTAAGSDDLGRTYVRKTPTADTLYIGRSSQGRLHGTVDPADDAYITILDTFLPFIENEKTDTDAAVYKKEDLDFATYGDEGNNPPVANAGIYYAQMVDGDDQITVDFDGSNSFATEPGGSISAYAWTFPGGTPASAAAATASNVVFEAGRRWVELTVTANSQTHTARALVVGAEASGANAPIRCEVSGSQELNTSSHRISFRVNQSLPVSQYMVGTVVIYWEDERYGNTAGSLAGPSDRQHIKFVGYLESVRSSSRATEKGIIKETIITCIDITAWLENLRTSGQRLVHTDVPAQWGEMDSPTIARFTHYILNWHSTVLEIADWIRDTTGSTYVFSDWEVPDGSLFEQCNKLAWAIRHELSCDDKGRLLTTPVAQELDFAGGGTTVARTTTGIIALTPADYTLLEVEEVQQAVSQLESSAYIASTTSKQKVYSRAPGEAYAVGASPTKEDGYLVASETEHNVMTGHRWARLNARYGHLRITLTHAGDAGIVPGLGEWLDLTLDATAAAERGITLTNVRCQVVGVSIEHNHKNGTRLRTLELEIETGGLPGQSFVYPSPGQTPPNQPSDPSSDDPGRRPRIPRRLPNPGRPPNGPPITDNPDDPPVDDPYPPGQPGGGGGGGNFPPLLPLGDQTVMTWDLDGLTLRLTKTFQTPDPIWYDVTPDDLEATFTIQQFTWSGFGVDGYLLVSDGTNSQVWYSEDLSLTSPVWTQKSQVTGMYTQIRTCGLRGQIYIFTPARQHWVHHFRFTAASGSEPHSTYGDGGFGQISPAISEGGQYSAGVGWIHTTSSDNNGNNIRIYKDWGIALEAVIVSATAIYDMVEGTGAEEPTANQVSIRLHSGTIDPGNINDTPIAVSSKDSTTDNDQELSINEDDFGAPTVTANGIDMRIWASDGGAEGSILLKLLTFHGLGFNPFVEDDNPGPASRFSSDYGATWGEEKETGASDDSSISHDAFDTVKRSAKAVSSSDSQAQLANAGGADWAAYGSAAPAGIDPKCIVVPRATFGTTNGDNSNTNTPEFLYASEQLVSDEALWKVTASGATFTDITPSDGSNYGVAVSGNCLWMPWTSGKAIAAILDFSGTRKLCVSTDAGATWDILTSLTGNADYPRMNRNSDKSLFWCNDKPYYSPDMGVTRYLKSYPGTVGGIAPYG